MKFQSLNTSIFERDRLFNLLQEIREGKPAKNCNRLTPDQLLQIPSIYATLDPKDNIPDIADDAEIKTVNDKIIYGKDLKAITMLMYTKPRTAYCDFKQEKQMRSLASGAVPIGLLGFKRFRNIPYDRWRQAINIPYTYDKGKIELNIDDETFRKIFKVDLLLGKTYASTYYDEIDDTVKLNLDNKWGLILLSAFLGDEWKPTAEDIRYFRDNMGNYRGSFATTYGAARIETGSDMSPIVRLYNKCDTAMRLLLAQRWAWYGMHRNSDMICDFQNWDKIPKNIDNMAGSMMGLKASPPTSGNLGKGVFGV